MYGMKGGICFSVSESKSCEEKISFYLNET